MNSKINKLPAFLVLLLCSVALSAAEKISLQQAIDLATQHDPRVDEKKAFVRKAEGLLQEAEGSAGLRFSVDSFLALTTGVDGGFFEDGAESCSNNCRPRDDIYGFDDGFSLWGGLTFSIIKPLATFGRLENYEQAAQQNIVIKQQDVELQRDAIRLDVVRAYYGYLTARDSRFLLEDTRERLSSALELVSEWLEDGSGTASQTDRFALQAGLGLIDNFLAEARGVEAIAMEGLKLLTGKDDDIIE
ncbi:MAG: outer membrane protein, partial [Gammaproteobacteria bacterium]